METENPKGNNIMRLIITLSLVIICVVFVTYEYGGYIYAKMDALKIIPTPERFTELYFTDPSAIPTSTTGGTIAFLFTINNLEGTTTVYPYNVYFKDSNGSIITLTSNTIALTSNTSTTIPISYTFPKSTSTEEGEVVVNLPSLNNQQIDFLLPNANN